MKNKERNLIRAIAFCLFAVLTLDFLSTGILKNRFYSLNLKAKAAEETGNFNIPVKGSVDDYDPEKNGYFAYLKLNYEIPDSVGIFTDTYLPVLCYNNCIYVRTDLLESITDLKCSATEDEILITSRNQTRRLHMTVGKNGYLYEEGSTGTQTPPLCKYRKTLDAAPVHHEESLYVPLNPVLCLFGVQVIISGEGYHIIQHREDALDILMKMYACADHDSGIAGDSYAPHIELDNANLGWGATADYLYGFLTLDTKALKMAIPSWGVSKVDMRYYEEIAQEIMSVDPDLAKELDKLANDTVKTLSPFYVFGYSQFWKVIAEEETELSYETIEKALEALKKLESIEADYNKAGFAFIPEYNYKLLLKKYSEWEKKIKRLEKFGMAADVACAVYENALIYAHRDTVSAVGMKVLLQDEGDGKKRNTGSILNTEEYKTLIKEFKNFVPDKWVDDLVGKERKKNKKDKNETAKTVLLQSADEAAMTAVEALLGMVSVAPSVIKAGLSTVKLVADCLNVSQISSANSLLKAYYGQILLANIGTKLYSLEKTKLGNGTADDEDYRDLIALAYLYVRLAKLECDYIISTRHAEEDFEIKLKDRSEELVRMLAILTAACERGVEDSDGELETELLSTPQMRIKDAEESLKNGIPKDAVIPLYMKVRGQVVEKSEEEPPVPDAKCQFSMDNDNSGYFGVDGEGKFSVYLPMADNESMTDNLDDLGKKEFSLAFSSESVDGSSALKTAFESKGDKDLGKIYLSNFNWYKYIGENIAPKMGWVSMETQTKGVGQNWTYPVSWDYRKGLLSAQIADLDDNGTEDCVLYYFDYDHVIFPGRPDPDDKSTVFVKVLTRDSDQTVRETGARQIVYEDGTGFCDAVGGIMDFDGKKYVYFECNTNAYYANGYGTLYTFYSCNGMQLRPDFAVGKTSGGSIEFAYSLISYDEGGDISGTDAVTDGSPWYNADGTYSRQILCADRDWKSFHRGESILMDSYDPPQAMRLGLSMITGIDPGEVILENADNGYAFDNTYISYRDMDCYDVAFHLNCNGEKVGSNGQRNMSVSVSDYTDLLRHVEEAGD